jgi:hypothetical protein
MSASAARYSAKCRQCRRVTLTAERFRDIELARLREHAGRCFSDDPPADDAGAGEVLRCFTVEREP